MISLPERSVIPYLTAGWPAEQAFLEAAAAAGRAGCPLFEVGIPFSDPVADGPTIQRASQQALESGVTVERSLELIRRAVELSGIPAVAMTYANLVYRRGYEKFCQDLAAAGGVGLIVPDLPLEESDELEGASQKAGIDLIQLATPTTPVQRLELLGRRSRGFLYLVSVRGVTGSRGQLAENLDELIARAVASSRVPVCVGFGISTPDQVRQVTRQARGVIVGSALLERLERGEDVEAYLRGLTC
ncbi:MAG: tryptophan synthase alpha chain [Candidatus Xenobia bacterium]|jgi:tryptophan synthase alpha chain